MPKAIWRGISCFARQCRRARSCRVTPAPIQLTTFRDMVPQARAFAYAVQAVDKAGNVSRNRPVEERRAKSPFMNR